MEGLQGILRGECYFRKTAGYLIPNAEIIAITVQNLHLTHREKEILNKLRISASNIEIARSLFISENRLRRIFIIFSKKIPLKIARRRCRGQTITSGVNSQKRTLLDCRRRHYACCRKPSGCWGGSSRTVDRSHRHLCRTRFYRAFSDKWESDYPGNLTINERPSARWGSWITITANQDVIYQTFFIPNEKRLRSERRFRAGTNRRSY